MPERPHLASLTNQKMPAMTLSNLLVLDTLILANLANLRELPTKGSCFRGGLSRERQSDRNAYSALVRHGPRHRFR
jgi:hypothetical protein